MVGYMTFLINYLLLYESTWVLILNVFLKQPQHSSSAPESYLCPSTVSASPPAPRIKCG